MKIEFYYFVIIACFYGSLARCDFSSTAVRVASPSLEALEDNLYSIEIHIATFEDILIHCVTDSTQSTRQRLHIRRRDAEGFYHLIHDLDNDSGSYTPITNGKWLALVGRGGTFLMGRLDSDFNFVNVTVPEINARAGGFYRNDTFTFHNWKDNTLRTIEYVNGEWVQIDSVALTGTAVSEIGQSTIIGNYFLIADSSESLALRIYGRQANGSWAIVDMIPGVGDKISFGVTLYDGVDSVVMATSLSNTESGIPGAAGLLTIYKKTSGQWAVQQQFTLLDLGVTSVGNAGSAMAMPDQSTILYGVPITANLSDSTPSYPLGKVFVIKRNETGLWSVTGTLYTNEKIIFGDRVFTNDYDHIILGSTDISASITLFSIPKCYDSPINVTCASMDLDNECAFDTSSLHTINNPQCGPVDAKLKTVGATSGIISVDFEFSRYATTATCTAQITCPTPPVAGGAPVASTPSQKTSDTWCINSRYFGVTMLLLLASLIF